MEICVLGPLRVTIDGRDVPLTSKQGILLSILALQPGQTVSSDRLMIALWGEDAPPTAVKTLQTHVFHLRRLIAPDPAGPQGPAILTESRGYRLALEQATIDAQVFQVLLDESRAAATTDPRRALASLKEALALWRGPAVADVGDEPVASAEAERLAELRESAFDESISIRLALGESDALVPDLRRAVAASPFRERHWADLMVALVRSGRKADALLAYREAEAALRRELDVEPSDELQVLAAGIRSGAAPIGPADWREARTAVPAIAHVADEGTVAGRVPRTSASTVPTNAPADKASEGADRAAAADSANVRRRAVRRVRVAIALPAFMIVLALTATSSIPAVAGQAIAGDTVGRLDNSGRFVASVAVGSHPDGIAIGDGSAWIVNASDDSVTRVDTRTTSAIQRIPVGVSPAGIAWGFESIWVANSGDRTIMRIDPTVNEVVKTIPVGTAPTGVATDGRWVWVTNRLDHTVSRINPTDATTTSFAAGSLPLAVAAAGGSVWVVDGDSDLVLQLDPESGEMIDEIAVGRRPTAIAAAPSGDAVWVTNSGDGTVSRISTASATVTLAREVGADPVGIVVGSDAVWAAVASTSEIVELDAATGGEIGRFRVGAEPRSLAVDAGEAWYTARAGQREHRGGELTVVSPADRFPSTPDPSWVEWYAGEFTLLTNDALVAFKRVGGPDGSTLVSDLAQSIPKPRDGGRTWTFQLRPGLTYSDGSPVRASDVRPSFERAAIAGNAVVIGAGLYGDTTIKGSADCGDSPPCDLSEGITFDDEAGTVTFHLVKPDPDFPLIASLAPILPAGTSLTASRTALPATGPYMFDRFEPGREARLVRNPLFREWSKDAQPDGYPDTIAWSVSALDDPSTLVESGAADVLIGKLPSADRLDQLRTRTPTQLHIGPSQKTWFQFMNARIPPFDDVRVRQAVSYATDRAAVVDAWGGPLTARITCQVIPPEFHGYEAYCPYTVLPSKNGSWLGPDLKRAAELIEQAGAKGAPVTVFGAKGGQHEAVARYFVELLETLGFRATIYLLPLDTYFDYVVENESEIQMAGYWSLNDSREGSRNIVGTFTCPGFPGPTKEGEPNGFCSKDIDEMVTTAQGLESSDPSAANRLWAKIDAAIVDQAPAIMPINPTDVRYVSERVGGHEHHPFLQIMLDQLWVH